MCEINLSETLGYDPEVDTELSVQLLTEMLRIRLFEDTLLERYNAGDIPAFIHLSHGHEGSHAGMGAAMEADDWLAVGGTRMHGQYVARGVPMTELMAEMYGKRTGTNRGKGGSMHASAVDRKLYGHAATIGSGQNPAVGLALAQEMLGTGNVAIATIGDGGTSRGSFHTALNMASTWNLPVVFIIENNGYAMSYDTSERLSVSDLSDYAKPFGIPGITIDGTDPEAVYRTVKAAITRAREGDGPTLINSKVYRLRGHSEGDKQVYRADEEIRDVNENHDPVVNYRDRLTEAGTVTEADVESIREEIEAEVDNAVTFAHDSEFPDQAEAYDHVLRTPLYGQE